MKKFFTITMLLSLLGIQHFAQQDVDVAMFLCATFLYSFWMIMTVTDKADLLTKQ